MVAGSDLTFPMVMERRHYSFFRKPDDPKYHSRKECQKSVPQDITLDEFKCCPQWRRKLSNKWNTRILAIKLGVPVPELYWHGPLSEVDNIPFETFPDSFVIKPAAGWSCLGAFIMKDGTNQFDGKKYTIPELKQAFKQAMKQFPNSYVMVEELIRGEKSANSGSGSIPIDFKCYLFGGELDSILAIRRLGGHSGWAGIYDQDWNFLGGSKSTDRIIHIAPYKNERIPAPDGLADLVKYAKIMGEFYGGYVRMDFYCSDKGVVIGECTPFSNLGGGYTKYAESQLGRWRKLEPELFYDGPISGDGRIVIKGIPKTAGGSNGTISRVKQSSNKEGLHRRLVVSGRPKKRV